MPPFIIRPTVINSMPSPLFWSGMDTPPGNGYPRHGSGNAWGVWAINNIDMDEDAVLACLNDTDSFMPTARLESSGHIYPDVPGGLYFDNTIRIAFVGASIYLDGSPTPISYAELPAGFTATSAVIKVQTHPVITEPYWPFEVYLQKEFGNNSLSWENLSLGEISFPYDFGIFPMPTMLDVYSNAAGLRVAYYVPTPSELEGSWGDGIFYWNLRVEGTYEIQSFESPWSIDDDEIPVRRGSPIVIRTETFGGATGIGAIIFTFAGETCVVPATEFTYHGPDEIHFYLPFCLGSYEGPVAVSGLGDGTTFSGTVPLGTLTVFFEDASGIYRIVPGKTTDTVYNPERDGTTEEVKIPNPFGASGFVDG